MDRRRGANVDREEESSMPKALRSVGHGKNPQDVLPPASIIDTNAPDAALRIMELRTAVSQRKSEALTPYIPSAWQDALTESGLISRYPTLPLSIRNGFNAGIQPIVNTYAPPNHPSIAHYKKYFDEIVQIEFVKGRYIGPFSCQELENMVGPFQTSPLALIEKPGKPDQYRLIQNLSFPYKPQPSLSSINHSIDSNLYPCTWGTFTTVCLLLWRLPPGSQGACRDVSEAFRTIPLAPDQWPGTVVHLSEDDEFALNTSNCFGLRSAGGVYGIIRDATVDLLCTQGIGPVSKWVDDHLFIRILLQHLPEYNCQRAIWCKCIQAAGNRHHERARFWYGGDLLPDGRVEEFDEDMAFPILDLSQASKRSSLDTPYSYSLEDVNHFTNKLGLPWELSKDIPFASSVPFTGLVWNLEDKTVSLQRKKQLKYIAAIDEWSAKRTHALKEVRKLYGKLLHTCLVMPRGRAYLMGLEKMLGIFHDSPEKPRTPPRVRRMGTSVVVQYPLSTHHLKANPWPLRVIRHSCLLRC